MRASRRGAIEQAVIGAAFVFNYQNRMADALGADIPRDKLQRAGGDAEPDGAGGAGEQDQRREKRLPWMG